MSSRQSKRDPTGMEILVTLLQILGFPIGILFIVYTNYLVAKVLAAVLSVIIGD